MPGLGKKTFTAGDVLIAGDVNNYLMDQTVMNFATTAARSSAIPVPSTGMVSYVGTTGTATIPQIETYTGSAWQTPYGLTLVANANFSGAPTFSIDNVFSAAFNNYYIQISDFVPVGSGNIQIRMRVGGVDNASANYTYGRLFVGAGGSQAFGSSNNFTANEWIIMQALSSVDNNSSNVTLTNPFATKKTGMIAMGAGTLFDMNGGNMTVTTSYTGFTLLNSAGGNIAGTVRVYGLRNS
jgi:hypothetical protein